MLANLSKVSMQVQFDVQGRLWVVGGPLPGTSDAVCIGVASCGGTDPGRQVKPPPISREPMIMHMNF